MSTTTTEPRGRAPGRWSTAHNPPPPDPAPPEAGPLEGNPPEADPEPVPDSLLLDALVTAVRLPVAVLISILLLVWGWPLELVLGFLLIAWHALVDTRVKVKQYFRDWPFGLCVDLKRVWKWAFRD